MRGRPNKPKASTAWMVVSPDGWLQYNQVYDTKTCALTALRVGAALNKLQKDFGVVRVRITPTSNRTT